MGVPGRTMREVGQSLSNLRPLGKQLINASDSVLGPLCRAPDKGLATSSYRALIAKAFQRQWWDSDHAIRVKADGSVEFVAKSMSNSKDFSLTEYNFGLFFGLAIQLYEATLVSDDTPWDQFRRAHPLATDPALNPWTNTDPKPLSRIALFGAHLFNDRTRGPANVRCSNCHEQAELTDASVRRVAAATNGPVRNRDGNVIDKGFNNLGLRPTTDDLGAGASDEFGPISASRRLFPDAAPATFDGSAVSKGFGVEGAFKIPSLRNVALTAPYFHNGNALTLQQTVQFYSRGGNVAQIITRDGTAIEALGLPPLTGDEVTALVEFMKALTDRRVVYQRAPFDHPKLFVPNGHSGNSSQVYDSNGDGFADDSVVEISAVGAARGYP